MKILIAAKNRIEIWNLGNELEKQQNNLEFEYEIYKILECENTYLCIHKEGVIQIRENGEILNHHPINNLTEFCISENHFIAASKVSLLIFDSNFNELKRINLLENTAEHIWKAIDNIKIYQGIAYVVDDILAPFWVFRVDLRDIFNPQILYVDKILGVNMHISDQIVIPEIKRWIVHSYSNTMLGSFQDLHIFPTNLIQTPSVKKEILNTNDIYSDTKRKNYKTKSISKRYLGKLSDDENDFSILTKFTINHYCVIRNDHLEKHFLSKFIGDDCTYTTLFEFTDEQLSSLKNVFGRLNLQITETQTSLFILAQNDDYFEKEDSINKFFIFNKSDFSDVKIFDSLINDSSISTFYVIDK